MRPPLSKATITGVISLIAGGTCTVCSFVIGFITYTHAGAQRSVIATSTIIGFLAFPLLWYAGRCLGKGGKGETGTATYF